MMSVAGLDFLFNVSAVGISGLHKAWRDAWEAGQKLIKELKAALLQGLWPRRQRTGCRSSVHTGSYSPARSSCNGGR